MKEDFLYFIWQHQAFDQHNLRAKNGDKIQVIHPGNLNFSSGPDFFNAKVRIGNHIWAGNIEIHVRSSDWFVHGHEQNPNYDNVILHVVWEYDVPVFNTKGVEIPVLELKNVIKREMLEKYKQFFSKNTALKCSNDQPVLNEHEKKFYEEALFTERLQNKTGRIFQILEKNNQDWETVLYIMLLRYFGVKNNSDAFEEIAQRLPYSIFKKHKHDLDQSESLLMGVAGLLEEDFPFDPYYAKLRAEYLFLKEKYQLKPIQTNLNFGRTRPSGFPTIRLSQFARLYFSAHDLFSTLIKNDEVSNIKKALRINANDYWNKHFNFGKPSKERKKYTGENFINNLILNVVLPLKYAYFSYYDEVNPDALFKIAMELPPEKNRKTGYFEQSGLVIENALASQAYIQLFDYYCSLNKCLHCRMGNKIFLK